MCRVAGILTFFEFEMFRIGQLLRELLSRRPSREDLERRGIYKGTTLIQVSTHCIVRPNVV